MSTMTDCAYNHIRIQTKRDKDECKYEVGGIGISSTVLVVEYSKL